MFDSNMGRTARGVLRRLRGKRATPVVATTAVCLGVVVLSAPGAHAASSAGPTDGIQGRDISVNQGTNYPWGDVAWAGVQYGQAQATDGDWTSPAFDQQYQDIEKAGLYKGAYHFARPGDSSGATQANFFIQHGGKWTNDGSTLPGMLDLEATPSAKTAEEQCYHQSPAEMRSWIEDFTSTYKAETGRAPMIYTTNAWWNQCVGNTTQFTDSPLMIAKWGSQSSGEVPAAWSDYDFWQHTESNPGSIADRSRFNGQAGKLEDLATNPNYTPVGLSSN